EPYKLPDGFVWCECDVRDPEELKEVYDLLSQHYVEDDDNLFRFNYSADFLDWALTAPGCHRDWVIGVRVSSTNKLVGFITATPSQIRVFSDSVPMAEVNFLCVHKKLRSKRLAPVLIKEITRRVNLRSIWQAVYTAGVVLPTPVAQCRYWHRSLNPKKLIEVGFSGLSERMTISRSIKLYRVKESLSTPGLRPAKPEDVPHIHKLLSNYLRNFKLHCEFTQEEVAHWLLPREGVVHVYVRTSTKGTVTDLISFYELPSSVIGNQKYKEIKVRE
ncbi:myristoyl CoA:protein N-myristoyltransferase, partial [Toxoplasma gondii MAS]